MKVAAPSVMPAAIASAPESENVTGINERGEAPGASPFFNGQTTLAIIAKYAIISSKVSIHLFQSVRGEIPMKTSLCTAALLVATLIFPSGNAFAARKITTVQGVLSESADGKKMLKTDSDNGYYFDPKTDAGKKILSICQTGKVCIVRGVINGSNIFTAYYVKSPEKPE